MKPSNEYKKIENCNYALELALKLKFSLVGIGGKDFYTGNIKLILGKCIVLSSSKSSSLFHFSFHLITFHLNLRLKLNYLPFFLALLWQCMRYHILSILKNLRFNGSEVSENDMIKWANQHVRMSFVSHIFHSDDLTHLTQSKVERHKPGLSVKSFKDPVWKDGRFLLDLIDSLKPGVVDYSLVKRGQTEDECLMNAQYALTLSRKIGCCLFLLPEDIVLVRQKMLLTFIGVLMGNFS